MMRRALTSVLLAVAILTARPARAGLYNSAEPMVMPGRNLDSREFKGFREVLIPLRQLVASKEEELISNKGKGPLYKRYELVSALQGRDALSGLSVEQLDVSAYLIRLAKTREAANLLRPAQFQERDNFLVLSNLATAEQLDGQMGIARDYLADALRLWPGQWSALSKKRQDWLKELGWKPDDFSWLREVETYQLKLLRARLREKRPAKELPADVDALFDEPGKLQFLGPSGKYEAGKLAPDQRARLPKNALAIVEQLLIWMPHDTRLYWLLGELFNAEGDVASAQLIFEEVAAKWAPLPVPGTGQASAFRREPTLPALFREHRAVLKAQPQVGEEPTTALQSPKAEPPPLTSSAPVDWKSLGVGFLAGIVVAMLAAWQMRDLRRRGRTRATN
jgi:hypothetical protein